MKSPRDKLQHDINSLESYLASLTREHSNDLPLTQELEARAEALMTGANTEDQQFVLAQIDRLRNKYGVPLKSAL